MFLELSWVNIVFLMVMTHITILTVTIYLHRSVAHRSLTLSKPLEHFFRFWNWMTTGQSPKEWASVHRKHHAFCERRGDPHSPKIYGVWNILFKGVSYYRKEATNPETLEKYGKFTPDDWIENNVYKKYSFGGLVGLALIYLALFGYHGIWMYLIQIAWIPFWAAGVINGLGHHKGYRNFNSIDASTNIFPVGLLIGGEELHNNHHAYPTSAKLSVKWYEFDIGWVWIKIFELLGSAKINKTIDLPKFDISNKELTQTSVQKILSHKFFIFELFYKKTKNEVDTELKTLKANDKYFKNYSLSKLRSVFYDITENLNNKDKTLLQKMLSNKVLNRFYNFKVSLLKIWSDKSKDIHDLKDDLQSWCNEVLGSGIRSLQMFANIIVKLT